MGILIKSIIQRKSTKRVRIEETGRLQRRNAIRGGRLRNLNHNQSSLQLGVGSAEDSNPLDVDYNRYADVRDDIGDVGDIRAGIRPGMRPIRHNGLDLDGMSLEELENRATELRRTLDERHNIRLDLDDAADRDGGANGDDNDDNQDNDNENQRLMYEIRRRTIGRTRQRRLRREPIVLDDLFGGAPRHSRDADFNVPTRRQVSPIPQPRSQTISHHISQPRSQALGEQDTTPPYDEYEMLMNVEPDNNWRTRTIQIHRNTRNTRNTGNTGDRDQRQRNRDTFVIMDEEGGEET